MTDSKTSAHEELDMDLVEKRKISKERKQAIAPTHGT